MTTTYRNARTNETAEVIMDGECLGANVVAKTCVRKTTDAKFAVISTRGTRLIKLTDTESHARNYNAKLS